MVDAQGFQKPENPEDTDGFSAGDARANNLANYQGDFSSLRVLAQAVPDLTVKVNEARPPEGGSSNFFQQLLIEATIQTFAGGNSASMAAPGANPRIDLISFNKAGGTITITTGAEAASPTVPALPGGDIALAEIFHRVGTVKILNFADDDTTNSFIQVDRRPFFQMFTKNVLDAIEGAASPSASDPFATVSQAGGVTTFRWEAKRSTGLTAGSFNAIAFTSAWGASEGVPVVIAVCEGTTDSTIQIRNVTKTGFDVKPQTTNTVVHWMAVSPGTWIINGNLITATMLVEADEKGVAAFPRQRFIFPRAYTAAQFIGATVYHLDNKSGAGATAFVNAHAIMPDNVNLIESGTQRDISATQCVVLNLVSADEGGLGMIAIEQTGAATNADSPTSAGTGLFKTGHKYEAGFNICTSNPGPAGSTVTFSSAFSGFPVMIPFLYSPITGGPDMLQMNVQPSTILGVINTVSAPGVRYGYWWIAMDEGADTVTNATRLI